MTMPLVSPPRLRPGDRVAVVAPSGPFRLDRLEAGCATLRSWGLDVVLSEHLKDVDPTFGYLAGTDADRAADLQAAWLDPSISGVLCARGGYGAQRIVDLLDWDAMRAAPPKVFAGYSDVTALHEAFAARLAVVTLHAPMVAARPFVTDAASAEHFRATLFEPESVVTLTSPGARTLVPGAARGVTFGGCASILAADVGAATTRPSVSDGILLLEDTDEELFRLDRIFTQLLRSGRLDGVAAIALGSWSGCEAGVHELALDRFGHLGVPIVGELGFGHGESSLTVPLGVSAILDANSATLTLAAPPLQ